MGKPEVSLYTQEAVLAKVPVIYNMGAIGELIRDIPEYKGSLLNGEMKKEVSIDLTQLTTTLRTLLMFLEAPLADSSEIALAYAYVHGEGYQFEVGLNPNNKGLLKIGLSPDDPSEIAKVQAFAGNHSDEQERGKIVRGMLTDSKNPFLQARIIGECADLFKNALSGKA